MMIEEAIERYTSNAEYERTHGNLQGCLEFRQLTEWLKELKQLREQTRWIPVSKRSPEGDGWYMTTYDGEVYGKDGERAVGMSCFERGKWIEDTVYAWMPLPEPYKAESEEIDEDND